jgi:hypothetical protein
LSSEIDSRFVGVFLNMHSGERCVHLCLKPGTLFFVSLLAIQDELVRSIDYDFQKFKGVGNDNLTVLRARQVDDWIREFIAEHPDAIVFYLGCGLDTLVMRINPSSGVSWYDVDYPEVIALREQFFPKRGGIRDDRCFSHNASMVGTDSQ